MGEEGEIVHYMFGISQIELSWTGSHSVVEDSLEIVHFCPSPSSSLADFSPTSF